MKKTVKFGGSSLADANQFRKVAAIIQSETERAYVVVSAPGKRNSQDTKVTDLFYQCYDLAQSGQDFAEPFSCIAQRYQEIAAELSLSVDLQPALTEIQRTLQTAPNRDYAASRGEYLNGLLMADYLQRPFLDPATCIFFQENGSFDAEKTQEVLSAKLAELSEAVIPGFYGSMPNGSIRTFSRGGSDITGAIVARAAQADLYENWTDVSGMLVTDPRLVEAPQPIPVISYAELRELSYMGASVMHEDAVFPVKMAGIPMNIRNTNAPADAGTLILPSVSEDTVSPITGIAGKKGYSLLTFRKDGLNGEEMYQILSQCHEEGLSCERVLYGIDTLSLVVPSAQLQGKTFNAQVEDGLALVAVVGRGLAVHQDTIARILQALADAKIAVRLVEQGTSPLNVLFGIQEADYAAALSAIYHCFYC